MSRARISPNGWRCVRARAAQTPLSTTPGDSATGRAARDRVFTTGANFYITSHLVVKADYQWFRVNRDFDRLDLGLGINY